MATEGNIKLEEHSKLFYKMLVVDYTLNKPLMYFLR